MGWSAFRPTGLTHIDRARASEGYTLITPPGDTVYLLDIEGRPVHRWQLQGFAPGHARLLPDGMLLVRVIDRSLGPPPPVRPGEEHPPLHQHVRRMPGGMTDLLELDPAGRITWRYTNHFMHHDFARLENGNTLAVTWAAVDPATELAVEGGLPRRPGEVLPPLLGDAIIEVDRDGEEVRRVDLWRLLDPAADPLCPLEPRWAWTHTNGIDVTAEGEILFSCRNNNRIGRVDNDGGLAWKWGDGHLRHQHAPVSLPGGRVMVFDNGMHRVGLPRSRVLEVDTATNEICWSYEGEPPESFFSGHVAGAHPLPNGNVFVCEGASGRLFEITREGEVVWEWVSPYEGKVAGRTSVTLFRADRYPPDDDGIRALGLR